MRNGRPPSAHSVHSFLHQYTGSFKKPPLRRPQSVIGGGLGSLMAMPRNGSRLGKTLPQKQLVWTKRLILFVEIPEKHTTYIIFYVTCRPAACVGTIAPLLHNVSFLNSCDQIDASLKPRGTWNHVVPTRIHTLKFITFPNINTGIGQRLKLSVNEGWVCLAA